MKKERNCQRFDQLVKRLYFFCQIFCAAPIIDKTGRVSVKRRLHNVWCLIILLYIFVVNYLQARSIPSNRSTIEKALYLSEFLTNCGIVTTLVSSAYYYSDYYTTLSTQLRFLNAITKDYEIGVRLYDVLLKELKLLCIFAGSFLFSCLVVDYVFNEFDILVTLRSCGAYNLPNLMITLNLAQYWLALRFICLLYKRLNDGLERILIFTATAVQYPYLLDEQFTSELPWTTITSWYRREFPTSIEKSVKLSEFVDYIRNLYSELDALLAKMVDIFGFIILLNLFGSFLDLSIEYFAVYKFYDKPDLNGIPLFIYKLLWLVLHMGRLFFILLTNHAIICEKSRTCFILNELPTSSKDIEHAVNRFQLQLMVRSTVESACGIIDLDLLFLGGYTSAMATYIIFLIQIDLGNISMGTSQPLNTTQ